MNNIRGILPGMFTMGNLACGFGSIVISSKAFGVPEAMHGRYISEAVWLIVLAGFFDFLDGMVARLSRSSSRIGVELDSLADIVSFGVAPAILIINFSLISRGNWAWILAFVYLMAGSFRLARFSLSASLEEKLNFVGLPIPSAAGVIVTYVLFSNEIWGEIRFEKFFVVLLVATAALMVSSVEYESMPKFDLSKRKDRIKILFLLLVAVGLIVNAPLVMFPLAIIYILYGLLKMIYMIVTGGGKGDFQYPKAIFSKTEKEKEEEE
ncbi:MAG: CDP-diacylglycerol--serine O-phosphatidyltransferase [candidate division Zixibacteria bacterium]